MLDIGWTELMVVGVLALLVVGPKELPRLLRSVGQFVGKARGMAREFQRSMEDAAREADLKELTDIKRDFDTMGKVSFKDQAKRSAQSLTSPAKKTAAKAEGAGAAGDAAAATKPPAGSPAAPPAKAAEAPRRASDEQAAKPGSRPAHRRQLGAADRPPDRAPLAADPRADRARGGLRF